jgi:hypothetical protein
MHLILYELLLLVQEVSLVNILVGDIRLLVVVLLALSFFPELVHLFELLVLLSENQVLLENLAILLRSEMHQALVDDALPTL